MQFKIKSFHKLDVLELYELLKLRNEVFIIEQNCIYADTDNKDQDALHVLCVKDAVLIGYARILPPGISYNEPSIGRVVVARDFRRSGVGKSLMDFCVKETSRCYKNHDIVISAQAYLIKFYGGLGFKTEGEGYLEDNIPHIKMRYTALV